MLLQPSALILSQTLCAPAPLVHIPGLVLVASPQLNSVSSLPPTCFQVNISDHNFAEFSLRLLLPAPPQAHEELPHCGYRNTCISPSPLSFSDLP